VAAPISSGHRFVAVPSGSFAGTPWHSFRKQAQVNKQISRCLRFNGVVQLLEIDCKGVRSDDGNTQILVSRIPDDVQSPKTQ
jgi:hypothetical protein